MPRRISLAGLFAALLSLSLLAGCGRDPQPAGVRDAAPCGRCSIRCRPGDLTGDRGQLRPARPRQYLHAVLPRLRAQIPPGPARVRLLQASQRPGADGGDVFAGSELRLPGTRPDRPDGHPSGSRRPRQRPGLPSHPGGGKTPPRPTASTLTGRPQSWYGFLALGLLSVTLNLWALNVLVARTGFGVLRWLWTGAMLAGVSDLTMNWTTGALAPPA